MVENELALVKERLRQVVETAGPEINEVGDYIFNGTGKRIRPALFLIAAYRSRDNLLPLIDAAVALELIHTASLLHDDVVDQASTRRGKDAVHIKWSNKISVLSGDYLLSQAFKMLVSYNDWRLMNIIVDIVQNMAEGEVEQAFADISTPDLEERYFRWIGKKSASFFAGCCEAGSLLGGGDREEQAVWSEFGYNLGIAFQLIDDLLDYTGEGQVTGKPLYGDLNNKVITLPLIRTLKITSDQGSINHLLQDSDASGSQISAVAQAVLEGDGPDYTYRKAEEHAKQAAIIISDLHSGSGEKNDILEQLTHDILLRRK
ncbi:MAG: polyprenyl synthetase family protein [Bacillota bacterium]